MKPKGRYEVLSAMLGLEPLIAFRNGLEAARTEFNKKLPQKVREAESQRTLLLGALRLEPVLIPVANLIEAGKLPAAKQHLEQAMRTVAVSFKCVRLRRGRRQTRVTSTCWIRFREQSRFREGDTTASSLHRFLVSTFADCRGPEAINRGWRHQQSVCEAGH